MAGLTSIDPKETESLYIRPQEPHNAGRDLHYPRTKPRDCLSLHPEKKSPESQELACGQLQLTLADVDIWRTGISVLREDDPESQEGA